MLTYLIVVSLFAQSRSTTPTQYTIEYNTSSEFFTSLQTLTPVMTLTGIECAVQCDVHGQCDAFAYVVDTERCEMLGKEPTESSYVYASGQTLYANTGVASCRASQGRYLNGVCYLVLVCNPTCNHSTAKAKCTTTNIKASVAPIRDQAIYDLLVTYKTDLNINVMWIDGNDDATEQTWLYHDGSSMAFTQWADNEPDYNTDQNVMVLNTDNKMHDIESWNTHNGVACAW